MRILGIDPGLATLGYGVVEIKEKSGKIFSHLTYGVISTPKEMPIGGRLAHIQRQLRQLIRLYEPDAAAVETLFFFQNQKTIIQIGEVHGIISLTLHIAKTPVYRYAPLQIKNVLTGNGRAEKKELEKKVKKLLRIRKKIRPDDIADALAVALCHLLIKK
ncbi:MAG: crossover junction endodeoxyribonuclease RuvC [Candidatus Colwellbacteria bacterium]|nr:crossover junction endodeoxyribonuclease RuvC [Candidatus Colwellbacteria bacterium]